LHYTQVEAANITSWSSIGGILGSILMGLMSDVLVVRSPVHLVGCIVSALSLSFVSSIRSQDHTTGLTLLITFFNIFESGASVVIGIINCDIGKDQITLRGQKAVASIVGFCHGVAGFGSILGQLLLGPV
jgi:sugar phosphate permease